MFSKSFVAPILLLALTSSVNAQACVYPALGVSGTPDTNNVQKPSDDAPCGTVNIAQNLDSSTPLAPEGGYYYPNVINFKAGTDGSESIATVKVDPTGDGSNFIAANIITNGPSDPTKADSQQQLKVKLPDNTKCTGGANKNRCLVLFTTTAGYGNCVVFSQSDTTAATGSNQKNTATGSTNDGKKSAPGQTIDGKKSGTGQTTGGKKRQTVPNPNSASKKNQSAPAPKDQSAPPPPPSSPPPAPSPSPSPVPNSDEHAKVPSSADKIKNVPGSDSSKNTHQGGKRSRGMRMVRRF